MYNNLYNYRAGIKTKMESTNYEKVLAIFFDNPTEKKYVREIARETKLNPNTILNIIKKLEKEELIKKEKKKHIVEIKANFENKKFRQLKRIYNLKRIYQSGLIDCLVREYSPELISVIGSYSIGEDIKKSDIDIVIVSKRKEEISMREFENKISRKIHLIISDYKFSEEFYTNLINGIVLYGYVKKL